MNRESRSEAPTFTKTRRPASDPAAWCLWRLESGAILVSPHIFQRGPYGTHDTRKSNRIVRFLTVLPGKIKSGYPGLFTIRPDYRGKSLINGCTERYPET
jgi:hypothetical protein